MPDELGQMAKQHACAQIAKEYAPQLQATPGQWAAADHLFQDGHHGTPLRPWSVTPDQQVLDQERQQLIEDAIGRLPENYRDVYVLADVEGLPNAEIADLLGLHVPAVKSRLHRARLLMRSALAPHFEEVTAS